MRLFALIVFGTHTAFELTFGLNAFVTGGSSSQSAADIAAQSAAATISARFLGSALIGLGVIGALVLFWAGVQSMAAKVASIGFVAFHGLGTLGVLMAARVQPDVLERPLTAGALGLHGALALGFAVLALGLRPGRFAQS